MLFSIIFLHIGAHIKVFSSEMVATYVFGRKKKGLGKFHFFVNFLIQFSVTYPNYATILFLFATLDLMFTVDETEENQKVIMRERYEQRKQLLLLQQQMHKADYKDEDARNSEEIKEWLEGLHLRSREEPPSSTPTSENRQIPISAQKGSSYSTGAR